MIEGLTREHQTQEDISQGINKVSEETNKLSTSFAKAKKEIYTQQLKEIEIMNNTIFKEISKNAVSDKTATMNCNSHTMEEIFNRQLNEIRHINISVEKSESCSKIIEEMKKKIRSN